MKDGCDLLGVSVEVHGVFAVHVAAGESKIENLQKKLSNLDKKVILIVHFVSGYCNLDGAFSF